MKKVVDDQQRMLRGMEYDGGKKNLYTEVLSLVDRRLKEIYDTLLKSSFWQNQSKLSLLIATGAKEGSDLGEAVPNMPEWDQGREYFALLEETDTKSLFGAFFETVLGMLSSQSERDASA